MKSISLMAIEPYDIWLVATDRIWYIIIIVGILVLMKLVKGKKERPKQPGPEPMPIPKTIEKRENLDQFIYIQKDLMSTRELHFFNKLLPVANSKNLHLFTKIRIADLLEPRYGTENWQKSFNKIAMKHVDFVLYNKEMKPVLVVELDDSSHNRPDRRERDRFVNHAMKSAGLPILHTRDTNDLERKIKIEIVK